MFAVVESLAFTLSTKMKTISPRIAFATAFTALAALPAHSAAEPFELAGLRIGIAQEKFKATFDAACRWEDSQVWKHVTICVMEGNKLPESLKLIAKQPVRGARVTFIGGSAEVIDLYLAKQSAFKAVRADIVSRHGEPDSEKPDPVMGTAVTWKQDGQVLKLGAKFGATDMALVQLRGPKALIR
jgi:hypothetical protein